MSAYPTAWAYEQVCAALDKAKAENKQLRTDLARAVDRLKDNATSARRALAEIRGEQLPTARRNSRRVEAAEVESE